MSTLAYRAFGRLVQWMNSLGTLLIIALMALINVDVFGRNLIQTPMPGVVELAEMAIVAIVFLQVGHTLRVGRFTRSDGFFNIMKKRRPKLTATFSMLYNLTGLVLFCLIISAINTRVIDAWEEGFYKGNEGVFTVPIWPLELTVLIGCGVMVVQFFAFIVINLGVVSGRLEPAYDEFKENKGGEEGPGS